MKEKFCCEEMERHLEEKEVALRYNKCKRMYGIVVLSESYDFPFGEHSTLQTVCYCPWCGTKLQKDLTDEFYDIIFDELNLDGTDDPNLPEKFKSDEWWRKRDL